ncbi:adenylyltransferase and sulfurtransferase [Sporothrix schenckii 1099-18]|uniref:Adenylyltransferase and sulfurtransferase uba4 n=2 Tax=Sporothrix schenckii TaxID=29908 RepID=U7PL73_SPOS1|nr:adenylyltransferase and sulfurtransferase [Sporothrix schenckii 1099-18]ERS95681.1 hypothetical protein HMPREF1624_07755 [Sporothrix schenckii ATCC 58251]KJR83697.1 adenylyltransferase and sulfurtransferase [Sporothrix schenckii 1099-18]
MSADLRRRIASAEAELQSLREQLVKVEQEERLQQHQHAPSSWPWPLQSDEYERYARQLILPGVGVEGQLRLKKASVLIVGAGGLGCPAALYLAGAGVGHLVLVDGDTVEASNLHRQIGHTSATVGAYKVDSLAAAMRARNGSVRYTVHREHLTVDNVGRLVGGWESEKSEDTKLDLVLDCTDHPAIRYLISDACVRAGIPLVSAAALRTDGQLAVLNHPVGAGPCYRCVFPRPPPTASQTSCAEGGVLGPVVGVMGVLQALQAIRVLVSGSATVTVTTKTVPPAPTLTLFSAGGAGGGLVPPSFRTVRLKGRRADCFACSDDAPLKTMASLGDAWPDYVQFCGGSTAVTQHILQPEERVSVSAFRQVHADGATTSDGRDKAATKQRHWLLDVREKEFYNMGTISGAINVPFSQTQTGTTGEGFPSWLPDGMADDTAPIYLVCRVGNDSQVVTRQLKTLGLDRGGARFVGDVAGGILAWKRQVDSTMPFV